MLDGQGTVPAHLPQSLTEQAAVVDVLLFGQDEVLSACRACVVGQNQVLDLGAWQRDLLDVFHVSMVIGCGFEPFCPLLHQRVEIRAFIEFDQRDLNIRRALAVQERVLYELDLPMCLHDLQQVFALLIAWVAEGFGVEDGHDAPVEQSMPCV